MRVIINPAYDVLEPGLLEIWYMKPAFFPKGIMGGRPDLQCLRNTHTLVAKVSVEHPREEIFRRMQAEIWSPKGEAREWIEHLGLQHTSMSVGDCLCYEDGTLYLCQNLGWLRDHAQNHKPDTGV